LARGLDAKGTQEDGRGSAAMEVWVGLATMYGRALGRAPMADVEGPPGGTRRRGDWMAQLSTEMKLRQQSAADVKRMR
jgi:hypothetical protein